MKNRIKFSNSLFKILFLNLAIGFIVFLLMIVFASFILYKYDLSANIVNILLYFAIVLGSFISAYMTTRRLKEKGFLYGSISGSIIVILFLLINTCFNGFTSFNITIIKICFIMISSVIGGILGVNKKTKRIKY